MLCSRCKVSARTYCEACEVEAPELKGSALTGMAFVALAQSPAMMIRGLGPAIVHLKKDGFGGEWLVFDALPVAIMAAATGFALWVLPSFLARRKEVPMWIIGLNVVNLAYDVFFAAMGFLNGRACCAALVLWRGPARPLVYQVFPLSRRDEARVRQRLTTCPRAR